MPAQVHALQQETYEASDAGAVAQVHDFLAAHAEAGRDEIEARYFLAGAEAGDHVELPAEVHRVLLQVIEAMQRGLAVTISPQSRTLTTQQVAELLNVSRPTVVKMLDRGDIPFEKVNTHRRIKLADALAYRTRRRDEQYEALSALYSTEYDEGDDVDTTLADLRLTRKQLRAGQRE
ncbi:MULTISPECIES: helix-turn-helix domain-containing protein [Curtobacterium]|uniref:helix-turn-helix domain-containing protein n=1 Tax=Curtobacterium TaxID=2034 RepID=UPI001565FCE5|nr:MULTISPECIES: helix-turn-helix domain-containing protein [Curtobacterium]MBT1608351.1 helix-turn-helix domain-containing protein [Curtobacterium flaccumfaciens pv. betae]MBT1656648.1 helix-turn-helix domain-containing protein [Curtobacterium flaccumfaciens pv. betae]MCE0456728.1 helix-turn-helix domain-containing protein [Curtobacterium allii]MCS0470823.1 helix-turn-helix domain-containing protein [Curtobacterium flaccumfaciens pv. betae]MCS0475685.1 helix-turn-helix domain-containing prote